MKLFYYFSNNILIFIRMICSMKINILPNRFSYFFLSLLVLFATAIQSASATLIRDTEIEAGLRQLALPLAKAAGLSDIQLRLIADESYNAFVRGGKTIYLHTGLLTKAGSTSEILGVLAHEIGHLAAGHAPRRSEAIQDAGLTTTLATLAAAALAVGGSGDAAIGVAFGGADRANRNYLAVSRHDESVADEYALRVMKDNGISADGMARFMRRLAAQRALPESRQTDYYLTHPGAGKRLLTFEDHIRDHGTDSPGISAKDEALMIRLIAKVAAYTNSPATTLTEIKRIEAQKQSLSAKQTDINQQTKSWPRFDDELNLMRFAIAHFRRGDMKAAITAVDELIMRYPNDPYLHEFAGDIYLFDQRPADAISAYHKALSYQQAPLMEFGLGRAYLASADQGNDDHYRLAAEAFGRAIPFEPRWPELRRQYAIALGRDGSLAQADLSLSEEAILLGDKGRAIQMARRALTHETIAKETRNRAKDILFQLEGN